MEDFCYSVLLDPYNATTFTPKELVDAYEFAVQSGWKNPMQLLKEELLERLYRLEGLLD